MSVPPRSVHRTRRLVAVAVALVAGLGAVLAVTVVTVATAPGAGAETVRVTPKGRFVEVVDVDRTRETLSLTSQVKDRVRRRLVLQDWGIDTDGQGRPELFASWFPGDRRARLSSTEGETLPRGCRRVPAVELPRRRGATVNVPGRCLTGGGGQPLEVKVAHTTAIRAGDRCQVQSVPKKGYLGPVGDGRGQAPTHAAGPAVTRSLLAKGC